MNEAIRIIDAFNFLSLVKVLVVVGIVVYVFFAYLMTRQIGMMSRAIKMRDDFVMKILGVAHFVFAILVLFLSLVIL